MILVEMIMKEIVVVVTVVLLLAVEKKDLQMK
jgi:hypothetical protein